MATVMLPPSRLQATLRRCTWLSLMAIISFIAILATEVDFPGKGSVLSLLWMQFQYVWPILLAIVSLRIR